MSWTLRIAKRAEKQLAKVPAKSRRSLLNALEEMQTDPFQSDIKSLKEERSAWRLRVGAYRIFFDVFPDRQEVDVLAIERRTSTTYS